MFSKSLQMWSAMMMVVLLVVKYDCLVSARSVDGIGRMEKLLSSSSSLQPLVLTAGNRLHKRAVFDQSCKGIYNRELFMKLEKVCEDCYNLYRKAYVGVDCRNNCYQNSVFWQCLGDLMMTDVEDDYVKAVQMVGR